MGRSLYKINTETTVKTESAENLGYEGSISMDTLHNAQCVLQVLEDSRAGGKKPSILDGNRNVYQNQLYTEGKKAAKNVHARQNLK